MIKNIAFDFEKPDFLSLLDVAYGKSLMQKESKIKCDFIATLHTLKNEKQTFSPYLFSYELSSEDAIEKGIYIINFQDDIFRCNISTNWKGFNVYLSRITYKNASLKLCNSKALSDLEMNLLMRDLFVYSINKFPELYLKDL